MPKQIIKQRSDFDRYALLQNSLRFIPKAAADRFAKGDLNQSVDIRGNKVFLEGVIVGNATAQAIEEEGWDIDVISPKSFRNAIESIEGDLDLYINSPGGNVFEAVGMLTALEERIAAGGSVRLIVNGLAASAATYFLLAKGLTERSIARLGEVMIHKTWVMAAGNADELRKTADDMEGQDAQYARLFSELTGSKEDEIMQLMSDETWFQADEAVEAGLVERIYEPAPDEGDNGDSGDNDSTDEASELEPRFRGLSAGAKALLLT